MTATPIILQYKELEEKIKANMKLFKSQISSEIKGLEKAHYQKNGTLPAKMPGSHYYNNLKRRDLAIAILRKLS